MKTTHILSALFLLLVTTFASAQSSTSNTEIVKYALDVSKSELHWKGHYSFLVSEHTGTATFTQGELITINGNITGGSFEVDMTSITNEEYEKNGHGPVDHLKDPDFFDVQRYPKASLTITNVTFIEEENKHKMEADMTIKGITKPIEFWPTVDEEAKTMVAYLKIDRTRWGIVYNNDLKDHAISDAIELKAFLQF